MSRIRVLDLAKELGIDTKTAIVKLQEIGIQVKNHFNALSDEDAAKLRQYHKTGKGSEKDGGAQKSSQKLIIRRKVEVQNVTEVESSENVLNQAESSEKNNLTELNSALDPQKGQSFDEEQKEQPFVPHKSDNGDHAFHKAPENTRALAEDAEASFQTIHQQHPKNGLGREPMQESARENMPQQLKVQKDVKSSLLSNQSTTNPNHADNSTNKAAPKRPSGFTSATLVRREAPPVPQPRVQSNFSRDTDKFSNQNQNRSQNTQQQRTGGGAGASSTGAPRYNQNGSSPTTPHFRTTNSQGQTPAAGGYRSGPPARPVAGSSPAPHSQGGGGARTPLKPYVSQEAPASTTISKEFSTRVKDRGDKDKDRRRAEEEESRKQARLKGFKGVQNTDTYDEDLEIDLNDENAAPSVRTMIPNRKKSAAHHKKREQKKQAPANPMRASKKVIRVDEYMTVNDLAGELSQKAPAIIKTLMKLGMMATINQRLDFETVSFVAQEFGYEAQNSSKSIEDILSQNTDPTHESDMRPRPPIITIMGHVDHGKTSLLDAIRSANVAAKEAGGITQHIGAYQIDRNGRKLTFLDTPGHEAFTSMRARGAQLTDVVVLVVAADDGVMPQTVEAIAHAKAAQVPIIVAINKIDKSGANIERITRELSEQGVIPEEWGGESIFVQVSAKTHQGLNELIDAILLQADVLDLKARREGQTEGVVIESRLDKARGPVVTVIVTQGTLVLQQSVVVGCSLGRIRAMYNDRGEKLTEALPAAPVEIIGLDGVPQAGDTLNSVVSDSIAKEAVAYRTEKQKQKDLASQKVASMGDLMAMLSTPTENKIKELPLIIKADTHGSTEAIKSSLQKIDNAKVKTKVILSGVGGITETDVILANASKAIILGFNVRPDRKAAQCAENAGVVINCFNIIYELIDLVQSAMVGTLAPIKQDKIIGQVEVRHVFSVPKIGVIAGCFVTTGKIMRNAHVRIVRGGIVGYTGRVGSLKRFKDDAKEVLQGFECGVSVENYNDIKIGDILEAFVVEEVAPSLEG